jgi:hypothetical protein
MENNKERDEAYRKSQNEVANLKLILKDLLGMDVNFIPKFKSDDSELQAKKAKEDRERLETQMFLANLRKREALQQSNALRPKEDNTVKVAELGTTVSKKAQPLYRVIFRDNNIPPVTITSGLYDNLITEFELMNDLNNKSSYEALRHISDGDNRLSIRQSDILSIVKV